MSLSVTSKATQKRVLLIALPSPENLRDLRNIVSFVAWNRGLTKSLLQKKARKLLVVLIKS